MPRPTSPLPRTVSGRAVEMSLPDTWAQLDPEVLVALLRDADAPVMLETPPENHAEEIAWLREQLG